MYCTFIERAISFIFHLRAAAYRCCACTNTRTCFWAAGFNLTFTEIRKKILIVQLNLIDPEKFSLFEFSFSLFVVKLNNNKKSVANRRKRILYYNLTNFALNCLSPCTCMMLYSLPRLNLTAICGLSGLPAALLCSSKVSDLAEFQQQFPILSNDFLHGLLS